MKLISENNDLYVLRFNPGTEVVESILNFCRDKGIDGAWIAGLGSAREAVVSFYNLGGKTYNDHTLSTTHEVASLTGNVSMSEGKLFLHMHGVFADDVQNVRAGHVKKLITGATCEIRLSVVPGGLKRDKDPETGLNILD